MLVQPKIMEQLVTVKLLLFAKAREVTGLSECNLDVPASVSKDTLMKVLVTKFPELLVISRNMMLALNDNYLPEDGNIQMKHGDELAVIPPLSGG
jgi:molybdopterin synthase catalytic subunit